jgi:hypothetical protein
MGLQTVPAYIGQTGYNHPVELDRNFLKSVHMRTGMVRYGDFAIAPTATAQQFSIAAGQAFLLGAESAQQGGYFAWSDASENLVLGAPSGSPRIDALLIRAVDTQYGSDPGSPRAEWDIVQGTPAASPVAPADSLFNTGGTNYKPGAWYRMADLRVNPGDTVIPSGQITSYLRYVRHAQGMLLAKSTDTLTTMVLGDQRYDIDTGIARRWNGTEWRMTEPYRQYVLLGVAASNVTFTIPSTLRTVRIGWTARSALAAVSSSTMLMQVNADTGANYSYQTSTGGAAAVVSNSQNQVVVGTIPAATATANIFAGGSMELFGWDAPHSKIDGLARNGYHDVGVGSSMTVMTLHYNGSGPYTTVKFFPASSANFLAGTEFTLEAWD